MSSNSMSVFREEISAKVTSCRRIVTNIHGIKIAVTETEHYVTIDIYADSFGLFRCNSDKSDNSRVVVADFIKSFVQASKKNPSAQIHIIFTTIDEIELRFVVEDGVLYFKMKKMGQEEVVEHLNEWIRFFQQEIKNRDQRINKFLVKHSRN